MVIRVKYFTCMLHFSIGVDVSWLVYGGPNTDK
jgi:hypothetical protein